jgi:hypothetical protein
MILISAHKDLVRHIYRFDYSNGKITGLLDNAIGVLVVNSLMISEPNLVILEKRKEIQLFFGDSEEWGTITEMPKLGKNDIALVVDVASGPQYKGVDISLENIVGFKKDEIKDIRESLTWEGFKVKTKEFDGNPDDEDEAWYWNRKGAKAISFIIPIENGSKGTGWHVSDCSITIEKVALAQQILKRTINYLL